jgi:hypothetical protein
MSLKISASELNSLMKEAMMEELNESADSSDLEGLGIPW